MDDFKWDDTLVKEFIDFGRRLHHISDMDIIGLDIEKFKQSKQPKPLFTTEDGKEIYEGNTYYYVNVNGNEFLLFEVIAPRVMPSNPNYSKTTFSTREKAEEYILYNKPCLSLSDCAIGIPSDSFTKLVELAKHKIQSK